MADSRRPAGAVRQTLDRCKAELLIAGAVSFGVNLLTLALPVYTLELYDRVLPSQSTDTLIALSILACFCLGVLALLSYLRTRLLSLIGEKVELMLSDLTVGATVRRALRTQTTRSAQGMRDLGALRAFISGNDMATLFDAPFLPVYLVVIFAFTPMLGWIAVAGAVALIVMALINEWATHRWYGRASQAGVEAYANAEATVRNAEAIEAMGMMDAVRKRWHHDWGRSLDASRIAADRANSIASITKFLRLALQVAIAGAGAIAVLDHSITSGAMIVSSILLGRALAPIENAIGTWKNLINTQGAWRRLDQLIGTPEEDEIMDLPEPTGRLRVDGLVFGLNGRAILNNVQFALEPGESLGIIGPSAAGKSTLAKLLIGVWPPAGGSVRLDDAEIFKWPSERRGQHIGYLPQDVELFNGTVRMNIARLTNGPSQSVVAATRAAGIHEMILHLPQGYETPIGEGGLALSAGQRQRIGLARALYGSPKLLVLDEPNSNLDADGEVALAAAIKTAQESGTTVVVIAHRPTILAEVDKLLVMRDGRVELFGPRQAVLQRMTATAQPIRPLVAAG